MTSLLDVNVLLALAWPQHVQHAAATGWFDADDQRPWSTTALTELAFVRISSNPAFTDEAVTPSDAATLLTVLMTRARHHRWLDDLEFADPAMPWASVTTHRHVTDARLVAIARRHAGRLVTFDRRLRGQGGDDSTVDVLTTAPG